MVGTREMTRLQRFLGAMACVVLVNGIAGAETNDFACGSLQNGYGPYDYRSDKDKLSIVEQFHLTPNVVSLTSWQSAGSIGADLDYTLRAFPNHHVALMTMARLSEREKLARPKGAKYSVGCYFNRALRFRDDDAMVRMIYAAYLSKNGDRKEALVQLEAAGRLETDNANILYNTGLVYFDLKDYDKALDYAHRAYALGFPLPGLREKLKRSGKWTEPSSPPSQPPSAIGDPKELRPTQ